MSQKTNEAKIYEQGWKKVMKKTLNDGVPMYPKGSKNKFKICGQIHFDDKEENMNGKEIGTYMPTFGLKLK